MLIKEGFGNKVNYNRVFLIAVFLSVLLGGLFCVDFFIAERKSCQIALCSRINPNFASVASLVRLSGIGPARAEAIVTYREAYVKDKVDTPTFKTVEDLCSVRGIGPATAAKISVYLRFE